MSHPVKIFSSGLLHGPMPTADITRDLRTDLPDPAYALDGSMRDLTGLNPMVRRHVFGTPGALDILADVKADVLARAASGPVTVAFACAGGKHRSVALAQALHDQLVTVGVPALVQHLHVHLPRVIK